MSVSVLHVSMRRAYTATLCAAEPRFIPYVLIMSKLTGHEGAKLGIQTGSCIACGPSPTPPSDMAGHALH